VDRASKLSIEFIGDRASKLSIEFTRDRASKLSIEFIGDRASKLSIEFTRDRASKLSIEFTRDRASKLGIEFIGVVASDITSRRVRRENTHLVIQLLVKVLFLSLPDGSLSVCQCRSTATNAPGGHQRR